MRIRCKQSTVYLVISLVFAVNTLPVSMLLISERVHPILACSLMLLLTFATLFAALYLEKQGD